MKTLKFIDVVKTGVENIKVHDLSSDLRHIMRCEIDFDVFLKSKNQNLQRPFVWNLNLKQSFVLRFLQNTPIGVLTIVKYSKGERDTETMYKIIDGKQRLSTLISFYNNEFPIVYDGEEYYFKDLDSDLQNYMLRKSIRINVVYDYEFDPALTDDDYIRLFLFLNYAGEAQSQEYLESLNQMVKIK